MRWKWFECKVMLMSPASQSDYVLLLLCNYITSDNALALAESLA